MPAKFVVLDHRFDAFSTEFLAKQSPVVAFVRGENVHGLEVSFQHLPTHLGIVQLYHLARYVENRTSAAIYQHGRFHRLERVIRPFGVVLAGGYPIHASRVDCLNLANVVQF